MSDCEVMVRSNGIRGSETTVMQNGIIMRRMRIGPGRILARWWGFLKMLNSRSALHNGCQKLEYPV